MSPKPSKIDRLPADLRTRIDQLLADPNVNLNDATAIANELLQLADDCPVDTISRAALGRRSQRMARFAQRNKQAREIAAMLAPELGAGDQGEVGKLMIQMLRTTSFEVMSVLQDRESDELDDKQLKRIVSALKELALITQRIEKAATVNFDREQEIKRQAVAEAAERVDKVIKGAGLSAQTVQDIRREILGCND